MNTKVPEKKPTVCWDCGSGVYRPTGAKAQTRREASRRTLAVYRDHQCDSCGKIRRFKSLV